MDKHGEATNLGPRVACWVNLHLPRVPTTSNLRPETLLPLALVALTRARILKSRTSVIHSHHAANSITGNSFATPRPPPPPGLAFVVRVGRYISAIGLFFVLSLINLEAYAQLTLER